MDNTNTNPTRLLKIKEVADMLGVHTATLRRWDKEGRLVAVRIGSRAHPKRSYFKVVGDRRYRLEDVQKLMKG